LQIDEKLMLLLVWIQALLVFKQLRIGLQYAKYRDEMSLKILSRLNDHKQALIYYEQYT